MLGIIKFWILGAFLLCSITICLSWTKALSPQLDQMKVSDSFSCREFNPLLGGGFKPNCSSHWVRHLNGKVAFDSQFSTDEFGRRKIPGGVSEHRKNNVLFFGCSFTLGAGVDDDQTTPYYFSKQNQNTNTYNYAGTGYGPQQMLALLTESDLPSQVLKVKGKNVGIYIFMDFHVQRAVGKPSVYNYFGRYFPFYELDANHIPVHKGNFENGRKFISSVYRVIHNIPFLNFAFERWIDPPSDADVMFTAELIKAAKKAFVERFEQAEFYVVFYSGFDEKLNSKFRLFLEKENIRYLDYTNLFSTRTMEMKVGDGHPSARAHELVGKQIAQDLNLD